MKKIVMVTGIAFIFAMSAQSLTDGPSVPYKNDVEIKRFIDATGTTSEPLIQMQAYGGAMASYNTMKMSEYIIEQNKTILKQNEQICNALNKLGAPCK